jgi:hypothetical protein
LEETHNAPFAYALRKGKQNLRIFFLSETPPLILLGVLSPEMGRSLYQEGDQVPTILREIQIGENQL